MIIYPKEIIKFLQNPDELEIEKQNNIAVITPSDLSLIELIYPEFENISAISENQPLIKQISQKYDNIKIVNGNALQTSLKDKSVSNIFIDKSALNFDADKMRIEFRRILENYWCDLVIFENKTESEQNEIIPQKFLENIFAGSWYEKKEFQHSDSKLTTTLYWNPPGYSEEELNSKEILEFVKACENYCWIIENYTKFTVRKFLLNALQSLTEYYLKGFSLPETCASYHTSESYKIYSKHDVNKFFEISYGLSNFLGKHNMYWSNFESIS